MRYRIVTYAAGTLARDEYSDAEFDALRATARERVDGGTCDRVEIFDAEDSMVFHYPPGSHAVSRPGG